MTQEEIKAREEAIRKVQQNGGVEVMMASAGSGKTFSLAREYIRLLMTPDKDGRRNERAYRHILAVTFTNKATGEMKARIISELGKLNADPEKSDYRDYLMERCAFGSVEEMQKCAGKLLSAILNDYGSFSVSTIDKFFQTTLRAFSREIGQFSEYQIELDRDSLVSESAARLLESLSENDGPMLKWLSDSVIGSLKNGGEYKIDKALDEFASGYLSESYADSVKSLDINEDMAFSEENIKNLNDICKTVMEGCQQDFVTAALDAVSLADSLPGFNGRFKSTLNALPGKDLGDKKEALTDAFMKKIKSPEDCFNSGKGTSDAISQIHSALVRILDIVKKYNTAKALSRQSYIFVVAKQLKERFAELLKEKNVLSIDDTNSILRDIIAGSDAPFIYEKTGLRYSHFLLDEFQDTARVQWDNFLPLLQNSIAEGCYNLIVGDVKQSIYRWRNSDWKILAEEVKENLDRIAENPLDNNFRSAENIVEFNNAFYKDLAARMDSQLGRGDNKIKTIYNEVHQNVRKPFKGWVETTWCDKDNIVDNVVLAVKDALDRGFSKKDIAVIVRTNKQGGEMAKALLAAGIDVVTNDSLLIGYGETVRRLVSQLYSFNDSEDKIHSLYADSFDREKLVDADSLTDMAEELLRQGGTDGDDLYVLAFMDLLREFVERNGNALDAFLKYWEEEGARRSVSAPEGSDAVTIITIHKVKGLDYPYVVLPFQKRGLFMKGDSRYWEMPDVKGTEFAKAEKALYHVGLSEQSEKTLFSENYRRELQMAYIDDANMWYVAMTRASQAMHIIGPKPADKSDKSKKDTKDSKFSNTGEALRMFIKDRLDIFKTIDPMAEGSGDEHFVYGDKGVKYVSDKEEKKGPETIELRWTSGSGNTSGTRLKISSDSKDFFSPDGETGIAASNRLRGTALHKIMEGVRTPKDLHREVLKAVASGDLDAVQGNESEILLSKAIADVTEYGWFDGDARVECERGIIDTDGESYRPDRVVIFGDHIDIIDYKFGKEEKSYTKQIRNYMNLYGRMYNGMAINAYLWYIGDNPRVEPVK